MLGIVAGPGGREPLVVVVDDDEAVRHSLEWLIESAGYRVRGYPSARALLGEVGPVMAPDCAILDIHMPETDGVALHGLLQAHYPGIPVIFITAFPEDRLAAQARALSPAGFFAKPLDVPLLLTSLQELLS